MIDYLVFFAKICTFGALLCFILSLGALLSGCVEGRYLKPEEVSTYCATHNPFILNPFGEEYATWYGYCNAAWQQQTLPPLALGANIWQNQQAIDRALPVPQAPIRCFNQGFYTICQ